VKPELTQTLFNYVLTAKKYTKPYDSYIWKFLITIYKSYVFFECKLNTKKERSRMRNTKFIATATIIFVVLLLISISFFYKPNQLDEIYISGAIENKEWTNDFKSAAVYLRKFGIKATLIETTGPIEVATLLNDPNSKLNTKLPGLLGEGIIGVSGNNKNLSSEISPRIAH
jgi:hypothetical protein